MVTTFFFQTSSLCALHVRVCQCCLWTCRQANYASASQNTRSGRKDVEVVAGIPLQPLPYTTSTHTHTYISTHHSSSCLAGGDGASRTQCQPLWSRASPAGPSGSYSAEGRCGWLVPLCNSSSASDTAQVCPLWPRLPGDCVNRPANLRKYPAGIFVKPASATAFHLRATVCGTDSRAGNQLVFLFFFCI